MFFSLSNIVLFCKKKKRKCSLYWVGSITGFSVVLLQTSSMFVLLVMSAFSLRVYLCCCICSVISDADKQISNGCYLLMADLFSRLIQLSGGAMNKYEAEHRAIRQKSGTTQRWNSLVASKTSSTSPRNMFSF